ncbi:MAG TPA: class II aldolase/adducin family protein [Rectinemataceae bacterium]|nr:class II aldolase/adducin family protein [Rectinemataceae bacterium]
MRKESPASIKRKICEIGRRMYDRGFVAANDGNISVRLDGDSLLVTPTLVSKGFMKPSMIVTVDLEGRVLSGRLRPSSELKMHLAVYRERPDVRAVVHAHPANATGFAVAGLALDEPYMPELVVNLGAVPLAPYATPSTEEVPESIEGLVKGHGALLLSNHGVLTWGRDLAEAYDHLETVELYAKILIAARTVGEPRAIAGEKLEALYRIREVLGLS